MAAPSSARAFFSTFGMFFPDEPGYSELSVSARSRCKCSLMSVFLCSPSLQPTPSHTRRNPPAGMVGADGAEEQNALACPRGGVATHADAAARAFQSVSLETASLDEGR